MKGVEPIHCCRLAGFFDTSHTRQVKQLGEQNCEIWQRILTRFTVSTRGEFGWSIRAATKAAAESAQTAHIEVPASLSRQHQLWSSFDPSEPCAPIRSSIHTRRLRLLISPLSDPANTYLVSSASRLPPSHASKHHRRPTSLAPVVLSLIIASATSARL